MNPGVADEALWIGQFLDLHFCRSTSLDVDFVAGSAAALMQFIFTNEVPRYTLQCAIFV